MPRKKKEEQQNKVEVKTEETTVSDNTSNTNSTAQDEKKTDGQLFFGTGRRKTAVARVFLTEEKGEFTVNDKGINEYFKSESSQTKWIRPFHLIGVSHPKAKFNASIKVAGAGKSAQLGAVIHGISRALAKMSDEYRSVLSKQGLLTRDPRMVERKKPFLHKARKRPQYSKR